MNKKNNLRWLLALSIVLASSLTSMHAYSQCISFTNGTDEIVTVTAETPLQKTVTWKVTPPPDETGESQKLIQVGSLRSNYLTSPPELQHRLGKKIEFEDWAKDKINEYVKVIDQNTACRAEGLFDIDRVPELDKKASTIWLPIFRIHGR